MVRSERLSSFFGSSASQRRSNSPATKRLRQSAGNNHSTNQVPTLASLDSTSRAAAGLAVLLGVAEQAVSYTASPRRSAHNEDNMPTSPTSQQYPNEASPVLGATEHSRPPLTDIDGSEDIVLDKKPITQSRKVVWTMLTVLFIAALVFFLGFVQLLSDNLAPWVGLMPKDPHKAALVIMQQAPVIDGHIDLPIVIREHFANNVTAVDLERPTYGHVDIPRLRTGRIGGFFWSVYVKCADPSEEGKDFLDATWVVRDTLEQIDVARQLIGKYPDVMRFEFIESVITRNLADVLVYRRFSWRQHLRKLKLPLLEEK